MADGQAIGYSFMWSTKIKCDNCKSEYLKKDLKTRHQITDIDDGHTEVWYKCPTCNNIITVYYV